MESDDFTQRGEHMTLHPEEAKNFFKNWLGLMAFINDKYHIVKDFGQPKKPVKVSPEKVIRIKTKLWENTAIIDEYIDSEKKLPEEDAEILRGWKNNISGPFIVINHLKKHSILMNEKEDTLYGVIGISGPISEMIPGDMLPMMIKTTLIPFKDRIIYDSVFSVNNVQIGPNMRRSLKESYSEIKEKKGIICSF